MCVCVCVRERERDIERESSCARACTLKRVGAYLMGHAEKGTVRTCVFACICAYVRVRKCACVRVVWGTVVWGTRKGTAHVRVCVCVRKRM